MSQADPSVWTFRGNDGQTRTTSLSDLEYFFHTEPDICGLVVRAGDDPVIWGTEYDDDVLASEVLIAQEFGEEHD